MEDVVTLLECDEQLPHPSQMVHVDVTAHPLAPSAGPAITHAAAADAIPPGVAGVISRQRGYYDFTVSTSDRKAAQQHYLDFTQ